VRWVAEERVKYQDGERGEEVWDFYLLHFVVLLCAVAVKLSVCGFCGKSPRGLVPGANVDSTEEERDKTRDC
jgi:hypothetical protein